MAAVPSLLSYTAARGPHILAAVLLDLIEVRVLCDLSPFGSIPFTASKNRHRTKRKTMSLESVSGQRWGSTLDGVLTSGMLQSFVQD